jgi:hypothetical protein
MKERERKEEKVGKEKQTEQVTLALDESIMAVMREHDPGTIVTKWMSIIRVESGDDDTSGTWILSAEHMDDADDMGILLYAITDCKARHIKRVLNEVSDDEDD